ncbi:MAG: sulfur carrier protein ThiS [Candidatus Hydrogenedentes bacterium]|nr:sulfur carrier protein ThiS [Candidatus Hydrogenedentota bacterium]
MKITINGEQRDIAPQMSVAALLGELSFNPVGTVVERNGVIVDRAEFPATNIEAGDTLEIVRFVGGG